MKDINKILEKANFKYNFFNDAKKHDCMKLLEVYAMPVLLAHVLLRRSQVYLFFASLVMPATYFHNYPCL